MIDLINNNPFAVLTAVAAPAILTNACSVLSLGTANRIARAIDRSRIVMALQTECMPDSPEHVSYTSQLRQLRTRSRMLLNALRLFYSALAMFSATALMAIIGSALVAFNLVIWFHLAAIVGFIIGSTAVIALVTGCSLMVRETRIAIRSVMEEHIFAESANTRA